MSTSQPPISARKLLLLVVEDDAVLRSELKEMLESDGYRVLLADDGQGALSVLSQLQPHLILLDLMMPVVSGWEVLAAIDQNPALSDVPVVVMSAYADQAPRGVAHVLKKPFSLEALRRIVQKYCAR
jgi:CheY-like chemotaxis protein